MYSSRFILLPGLGMSSRQWPPALLRMLRSKTASVYTPSYPSTDSIESFASHTWKQIDNLPSVDRTVLIGYSMGGFVAQEMTAERPEQVDGLVLIATRCSGAAGSDPTIEEVARMMREYLSPEELFPRKFLLSAKGKTLLQARKHHSSQSNLPSPVRSGQISAVLKWRFKKTPCAVWSSICLPVLIIQGNKDVVVPSDNAKQLYRASNMSCKKLTTLVLIPDAGHGLVAQIPEKIASIINSWFEKV